MVPVSLKTRAKTLTSYDGQYIFVVRVTNISLILCEVPLVAMVSEKSAAS